MEHHLGGSGGNTSGDGMPVAIHGTIIVVAITLAPFGRPV